MSEPSEIVVRGARVHNLRDVYVRIPRGAMTVITGPSGSGKSSLAFHTIYAEGQRRYVESLHAYARQFLDRLPRPDVDLVEGLSPAIAVRQEAPARSPRSTVATITEIHDFLRLLYARVGQPHCPRCGDPIHAWTVPQMVDRVLGWPQGSRFTVQAPVVRGERGALSEHLTRLRQSGFVRVVIDGALYDLGDEISLDPEAPHDLEVQVDRLAIRDGVRARLASSIELALSVGSGFVRIDRRAGEGVDAESLLMSERFACAKDFLLLPPITTRTFSWNSPEGACGACGGVGEYERFDAALAVPDPSVSLTAGAVAAWGVARGPQAKERLAALSARRDVDLKKPFEALDEETRRFVLFGEPSTEAPVAAPAPRKGRAKKKRSSLVDLPWEGVLPSLERQWRELEARREEDESDESLAEVAEELARFRAVGACATCAGARLRPEALLVRVEGLGHIHQAESRSIDDARDALERVVVPEAKREIAEPILREVRSRLRFLHEVGVGYLGLSRKASTLSGGEAQRIRLATRIGASLVGVIYVLDEPTVGLHPRDTARLIGTLERLRDQGATVLVVEHDLEVVRAADHIVDMGPGAGERGGRVVASGDAAALEKDAQSVTGPWLSGRARQDVRLGKRRAATGTLEVRGARMHNLRGLDVDVPLGVMCAITGVSGSGKSSLATSTILPVARAELHRARSVDVRAEVRGLAQLERVVAVDQAPIGRTARSNPSTYTQLFGPLRELFASLPEARARGWDAGRFSMNQKGGRCEACRGEGAVRVEMHFLPDVLVTCEVCGGARYERETLDVRYRGLSIADVLALDVDAARQQFAALPPLRDRLEVLRSVGLGYLELGRPAPTLSGGEAQRLALARELARRGTGKTLYVLDEPTTGLHPSDVEVLLDVMRRLVDDGHSVIVVEHDMDVVAASDWVIDLGPEGGPEGGALVVAGTPEDVIAHFEKTGEGATGRALAGR